MKTKKEQKIISFRVTEEEFAQLKSIKESHSINISNFLRQQLNTLLDDLKNVEIKSGSKKKNNKLS